MFRFGSPYMLYLLLLIPVMVGIYLLAVRLRAKRLRSFGNPATVSQLMPEASPRRARNKFVLFVCAIALMIIALARPQFGSKLKEELSVGIELMFVVDVSNSMLAQDFEPNRLERTKSAINRMLGELRQDKIGLIVFAGDAYVQLPITSDYTTARNFVGHVSTNMVTKQGTAIGAAIELATNSFSSYSEGSRVIILISDGENHEDDPIAAAEAAASRGIQIYTIGIGTPEGAPIPMDNDFLKDENDQIVVTKLDEETLQRIALITGGSYIRATNQSLGIAEIVEKINETQKRLFVSTRFEEYDEQFQYPLTAAFILLIIEMIMLGRKNRILARFNIFKKD